MAVNFNWSCPYCNRDSTITDSNFCRKEHFFAHNNKEGDLALVTTVTVCPNADCKEYIIAASLHKASYSEGRLRASVSGLAKFKWTLKPASFAKQFPSYIPVAIINDYNEACAIRDISPKASATLSRRCLQGMIRDFFKIEKNRLIDEINAIREETDSKTWDAIDSVRKIGNIGAHMEKDINLIVDVEPNEAQSLIILIEILIEEWYVARYDRQKNLERIIEISGQKVEKKKLHEKSDNL